MAPKQATLGYVKSGQRTLGCIVLRYSTQTTFPNWFGVGSKFFGNPNGVAPEPQQSKLAFKNPKDLQEEVMAESNLNAVSKTEADTMYGIVKNEDLDGHFEMKNRTNISNCRPSASSSKTTSEEAVNSIDEYQKPSVPNGMFGYYYVFFGLTRRLSLPRSV